MREQNKCSRRVARTKRSGKLRAKSLQPALNCFFDVPHSRSDRAWSSASLAACRFFGTRRSCVRGYRPLSYRLLPLPPDHRDSFSTCPMASEEDTTGPFTAEQRAWLLETYCPASSQEGAGNADGESSDGAAGASANSQPPPGPSGSSTSGECLCMPCRCDILYRCYPERVVFTLRPYGGGGGVAPPNPVRGMI